MMAKYDITWHWLQIILWHGRSWENGIVWPTVSQNVAALRLQAPPCEHDGTAVIDQVIDPDNSHGTWSSYIIVMTERGGRYHKRVKPWSLATETGCWLGRVQPPRESWCPVALMEGGGTSSLLRPLRGLIGTLKWPSLSYVWFIIHCKAATDLFPWRL